MNLRLNSTGYVALLAVLIVGAASLAIATSLLLTGTDAQRSGLVHQQSAQARSLASACAEEGLLQIHDLTTYTGTGSLNMGQGSCDYTVTNTGGSNRTLIAIGTVNGVVRKLRVYVTITSSSLSIISWQEVSDA